MFFAIFLASMTIFAFQQEKGKIDMHGGKYQSYGGLSKSFKDINSTQPKKPQ